MFNNLKIGKNYRVILIILMSQLIGFYALVNLSALGKKLDQIATVELHAVNNLRNIDKEVNFLVACQRGLALGMMFNNENIRNELFSQITASSERLEKTGREYETFAQGGRGKGSYGKNLG